MGALVSIFTGGLPFGGSIIAVIALAFGGFWFVEKERIADLGSQITELHCQIDGPTQAPPCTQNGFRAQLSAYRDNAARDKHTIGQLNGAIDDTNVRLAAWERAASAASKRAAEAEALALARAHEAQKIAPELQASRPSTGDYADLVKLIQGVPVQ